MLFRIESESADQIFHTSGSFGIELRKKSFHMDLLATQKVDKTGLNIADIARAAECIQSFCVMGLLRDVGLGVHTSGRS